MATEKKRGVRKTRQGEVISAAMNKTLVVRVDQRIRHQVYGKEVRRSGKCYAHDEKNEAKVGDEVIIVETRPLSKLKRWRLVEITKKATS